MSDKIINAYVDREVLNRAEERLKLICLKFGYTYKISEKNARLWVYDSNGKLIRGFYLIDTLNAWLGGIELVIQEYES